MADDDELFFVRDRQLEYPVFDVDNHMYENTDSFTKFIPKEYDGLVKYIQEGNRHAPRGQGQHRAGDPEPHVLAGRGPRAGRTTTR